MNIKLLLVAALTLSGSAFAQQQKFVKVFDENVQRISTPINRNYEARATIFSQVFDGPGLGQFTESHGVTSTAPHWAYRQQSSGVVVWPTTNAEFNGVYDEYLTVTNPVGIPDPGVDGDVYRLQLDMNLDYGYLNAARGAMGNLKIQLSNDNGASWTDFWFEEDATMLRNTFTSWLPDTDGSVDISPIINIPNSYRVSDFKFRVSLTGTTTGYQVVKGVSIYSVPPDFSDAITNFLFSGDIVDDFEYGRIAMSQVTPIVAGLVSTNIGFSTVNKDVTFIVRKGNTEVHSESAQIAYTLGQTDTTFLQLDYTPDEIGFYTLVSVIDNEEGQARDSVVFEVTDFYQSHSTIDDLTMITSRSELAGFVSQFGISEDVTIYGANVYLWNNTTPNQSLEVLLHRYNGTAFVTEYQGDFVVTTSDFSSNSAMRPIVITFDYNVPLVAGDFVRLEIRKGAAGTVGVLAKVGDNDNGSLIYGDFGSAGVDYYGGVGFSYGIELNFDPSLSIAKVEGMENVTVFPNPTNGIVNVSNSNNEVLTVNVTDVTGKQIASTSVFGNGSIDLSSFGAGVYVLEMTNGSSRAAQRVIVK